MMVAGFFALFWALMIPDAGDIARLAAGIFGLRKCVLIDEPS